MRIIDGMPMTKINDQWFNDSSYRFITTMPNPVVNMESKLLLEKGYGLSFVRHHCPCNDKLEEVEIGGLIKSFHKDCKTEEEILIDYENEIITEIKIHIHEWFVKNKVSPEGFLKRIAHGRA